MQGTRRKLLYVTLYEVFAVLITGVGLATLSDSPATHAGLAAVLSSAIALAWNYLYTSAFESWEARQTKKGRSLRRRVLHAAGFELGLVILLVPLFAWILDVTLYEAFLYDLGLIVFFLVYTFVFNLGFDAVFGLPASAQPAPGAD